jgi:alkylhydroperoxidase family enzyme
MARLPYLDPADAEPQVAKALGRVPPLGIFRLAANAQGAFIPWLRFGAACLDGSEFDGALRELAILRVARMTPGADYEWVQHVPIALAVGATQEQVDALERDDPEALALGEDGRLVVRFTTEVVRDAAPSEATFAAMAARFSPREIVHLLMAIGNYMLVARIMATSQIDLDAALGGDVLANAQAALDRAAQREEGAA